MYELKKNWKWYLLVNLLGPGPRLMEKRIYRAAVSQRFRNTDLYLYSFCMISLRPHWLFLTIIIWDFIMNAPERGPQTMKSAFRNKLQEGLGTLSVSLT